MKTLFFFSLLLLISCANQPDVPAEYIDDDGNGWVMSTVSSPVSGSIHLYINSKLVASGSFGLFAGNKASGGGKYLDRQITFHCSGRGKPNCLIYADGKKIAETRFTAQRIEQ